MPRDLFVFPLGNADFVPLSLGAAERQRPTAQIVVGTVIKRSAASLVDRASNIPYFQVTVEVSAAELARLGDGKSLLPGMQGPVYLATSKRTVLSYLVKPVTDQFERALRERARPGVARGSGMGHGRSSADGWVGCRPVSRTGS